MFDGHAGYGAALAASLQFHHILHEKLVDIIELLLPKRDATPSTIPHPLAFVKNISKDELIVGALEASFYEMDSVLSEDRDKYRNAGGCTALVALFILGKMYVANAGDSRAIMCQRLSKDIFRPESDTKHQNGKGCEPDHHIFAVPLSFDHTPDTERPRLLSIGKLNSNLMGGEYNAVEYAKKPLTRDLGARTLYRQGAMKGWAYKTLTREDLKMPLVTGECSGFTGPRYINVLRSDAIVNKLEGSHCWFIFHPKKHNKMGSYQQSSLGIFKFSANSEDH